LRAIPLFFLDYLAFGKLRAKTAGDIVKDSLEDAD
jgi:phosphoribosylaminoimidazole (AIR) synthetase